MLATVLLGFVGGMGNLLGSLRLSENGLSPSGIGALFSVGALVWIVVAPLAGRLGEQRSHVALTAVGCALLGGAWLVPVADRSTAAIAAFLLASMAGRAGLNTFSYLLAGSGAESAGAGRGAVIGLVNLSWGVAAVIGPLAASEAHGNIDERMPFAIIAALCLAVAALLFAGQRPRRRFACEGRARRRLRSAGSEPVEQDRDGRHVGDRAAALARIEAHLVHGALVADRRRAVVVAGDRSPRAYRGRRLLAGPATARRTAGGLPALERGVAQHAVGRLRPLAVEADRERRRCAPAATSAAL